MYRVFAWATVPNQDLPQIAYRLWPELRRKCGQETKYGEEDLPEAFEHQRTY